MQITLENLSDFLFDLKPGDRIFLVGKLWAGKTTFAQALIRKHLQNNILSITSPTYIYYQNYPQNVYHFDLYRIEQPEDLTRIWAEEIFENPENICLIEWPEKLFWIVQPTKMIEFSESKEWREICITNCQAGTVDN
jgi:tRNA threonylcarbamoyladenosine biosynthesis protein TsaE